MKKIFFIVFIIVFGFSVYKYKLYDVKKLKKTVSEKINFFKKDKLVALLKEKITSVAPPKNSVTVYLKNKSFISGTLVNETKDSLVINWKGGNVEFSKNEIEKIEYGKHEEERGGNLFSGDIDKEWKYSSNVVIELKNGNILDSRIKSIRDNKITLETQLEGGGSVEQDITRFDVANLIFKPVYNEKTRVAGENLRKMFPKMKFYREGQLTIITDSYYSWVQQFKKALRDHYTEFYLDFFDILKDKEPSSQNFVIIFDNWIDFVEYAVSDGVPGWAVLGYFNPANGVLYSFNALGDKFSEMLYEVIVGKTSKEIDSAAKDIKSHIDNRYEIFVEGQADEIKEKFQHYHAVLSAYYKDLTFNTLRHEFTHELFYNWGAQNISMSKIKPEDEEKLKKKKEFLDTKDIKKKRELFLELAKIRGKEEDIKFDASNSWFVEGLATYSETCPIGEVNKEWLYLYQEEASKNALFPIEHLTVFKMGSFPGMASKAMLNSYAQSWALVYFLMNRHREEFFEYLNKLPKGNLSDTENLQLFLRCMKSDLRTLEQEFYSFMGEFNQQEDPYLEQFDAIQSIFSN